MPIKRERSRSESDYDDAGSPSPSKRKSGSARSTPKKAKSASTPSSGGGKKVGAWSKDELEVLYSTMCPKRVGVKWDEVASALPGRDAKACQNKWSRMQGKIMDAIRSLGE